MSDPPLATKIPAYMICIAKNNQLKQSQAEETLTDHKLSQDGKTINWKTDHPFRLSEDQSGYVNQTGNRHIQKNVRYFKHILLNFLRIISLHAMLHRHVTRAEHWAMRCGFSQKYLNCTEPNQFSNRTEPNRSDLTSKVNSNRTEFCGEVSVRFCGWHTAFGSFMKPSKASASLERAKQTTFESFMKLSKFQPDFQSAEQVAFKSLCEAFESFVTHTHTHTFIRFSVGSVYKTAKPNYYKY